METIRRFVFFIFIITIFRSNFCSPVKQNVTSESEEMETTTEYLEIIFRVDEDTSNDTIHLENLNKQIPLPTDEIRDPVKDSIVVFRQYEEEDEDESDEEEEEEVIVASSSTSRPSSTRRPSQATPSSASQQPLPSATPSSAQNFEEQSSSSPSELEESSPDFSEILDSPPPPSTSKPTIQPVQEGILPVQEPGVFTPRPKTTTTTTQPTPIFVLEPIIDNSPGIPVQEINESEDPVPALPELKPSTGKYKITKPKNPNNELQVPASSVSPPLSISEEWNLTSSIFTLTPQGRADCECGKIPFKVDNADKSGINEYPWTIAVILRAGLFGGGRPHCGGVLINNLYVLSTASCFESLRAEDFQIWLTAHNTLEAIDNFHTDRVLKRQVREIFMHPNYDRRVHENDIALIKMSHPVDISTSSYYVPACLPAGMSLYEGMTARVMGWGSSLGSNRLSTVNKMCKEDIPVISNDVCNRDTSHRNKITTNQLCAGFLTKQPSESCIGDAGGPLLLPNNGRFTLIGLVSHGYSNRQAYTPVVYTRVGSYAEWILHNTHDADWCSL